MASGSNADAERAFNRAQLKLNLNLPSIDTPRSLTELQSIAHEIQRQKLVVDLSKHLMDDVTSLSIFISHSLLFVSFLIVSYIY